MTASIADLIRQQCRPLAPIATGEEPVLQQLTGIRAVMFDVYGTLLISSSGDIDASEASAKGEAFEQALAAVGLELRTSGDSGVERLTRAIAAEHALARQQGIEFPEVDIREIWRQSLAQMAADDLLAANAHHGGESAAPHSLSDAELCRLALEYELRVNPVWPMPQADSCLEELARRGLVLGIISNAQFLTIDLWRALLPSDADSPHWEIPEDLQFYSFRYGVAKPGLRLYELAQSALALREIPPEAVLYIGNDMLKDVQPAQAVGFRTAFFAGDERSRRRRAGDPRVAGVRPDLVITDFSQLPDCLSTR